MENLAEIILGKTIGENCTSFSEICSESDAMIIDEQKRILSESLEKNMSDGIKIYFEDDDLPPFGWKCRCKRVLI